MAKVSKLQFLGYDVEELLFKSVPGYEDQDEFQFRPRIDRELADLGDNRYDMKLSVEIVPSEEYPMPFELRVVMVGHFSYSEKGETADSDLKDQVLRKNTVAILFPFLRQIVASLTNTANTATLMLPIMNLNDEKP